MAYTTIPGGYTPVPDGSDDGDGALAVEPWVRPTDWVALPTVGATEQKFVGLLAVTNDDSNFIALNAAGDYTVDWGDGSAPENIASGVQANHLMSWAGVSAGTLTSLGYRQAIVTVTPQAGQTLATLNLQVKHSQASLNAYTAPWLDITVGSPGLTSLTIGAGSVVPARLLQRATILSHALTSTASLFFGCNSLRSVPLFDTSTVTAMNSMFSGCAALQEVPLFNTAAVTTMASMFANCPRLVSVPLFNTAAVTTMATMFNGCTKLDNPPLFNTASVTTMASMFNGCAGLVSVPLFNTASVTTMASMFNNTSVASGGSLRTVPLFNTAAVTTMNAMFSSCGLLQTVPLFNTAAVTDMGGMFASCASLTSVPALDASNTTSYTSTFLSCPSLAAVALIGTKATVSYQTCKLSAVELERVATNLASNVSGQTFTVTGNWGAPSLVILSGTTVSTTTVTMASTAGLTVGMEMTGTNISTAVAVTTQDAGDTVTRTAHGIPDGTQVAFATLVTTTGVTNKTPYYVVNGTANTFQLSLTPGGAVLPLTTDGSGTLTYPTTITAIVPDVSVTLSIRASGSSVVTTSSGMLKRSLARLKGWTVTG